MNGYLLRFLIVGGIILLIVWSLRRLWRDWTAKFRADDTASRERLKARDAADKERGGIIDLKRDKDGTYRPDNDNKR